MMTTDEVIVIIENSLLTTGHALIRKSKVSWLGHYLKQPKYWEHDLNCSIESEKIGELEYWHFKLKGNKSE